MGEYNRLNKMLREKQEVYNTLESKADKTDEEMEALADLYQSIGEIKGALFEMAEVDGLSDPYEAFDYCEEEGPSAYYTEYDYAYLAVEEGNEANAIISIDAYPMMDDGEQVSDGYSIAHVILSVHNDIIVVWSGAEGRENPEVLKLIDKAKDELRKNNSSFRTVKIAAGMTQEFEIIRTDAPDHVIKAQLMYISACEEEGKEVPKNPYGIVENFGYVVSVIGCQDDFDFDALDELIIDAEFDYYDL